MIDFDRKTPYDSLTHDELKSHALRCNKCDLCNHRTQVVYNSGPNTSTLMIIGEAPGQQEDESGTPFIGRSGKLLTQLLTSCGIHRDDIYITNSVKCRPPGNRTPKNNEMTQCRDYLIRQIQQIKPRIIILLGAASIRTMLGPTERISNIRGQWQKIHVAFMPEPISVMPMFHPSYLLRYSSQKEGAPKWLTMQDLKEVKVALKFYDTI